MSNTDDVPTQPSIPSAPQAPTPLSMPAMTIEYRLKLVEDQLRDIATARPLILAELRSEMANIRAEMRAEYQVALASGLAEEAKKREALELRFNELSEALKSEMGEQTAMLKGLVSDMAVIVKSVSSVFANPKVRQYSMSILASLTIILGVIATWLAARSHVPPAPPPSPAVTVVLPPSSAPAPTPKASQ